MQSVRHLVCLSHSICRSTLQNITGRCRYMCSRNSIENPIENSIAKQQISFVESESSITKPTTLTIDWDIEMEQILAEEEEENKRSILAPVEDESKIYAEPMLRPTFNLAAYVSKSEILQQFLKLGVNLSRWDELKVGQSIAKMDFKRDIEPFILLLTKDISIPVEQLGDLFTRNPLIFKEHPSDLLVRVNYLALKRFKRDDIITIVTRNPFWLSHSTRDIDMRLGFVQKHFELSGYQVRLVTVGCPKLITHNLKAVQEISFSIREECVFSKDDVKKIITKVPKVWMMHRFDLMWKYDFIMDHMKIDNAQLVKQPYILADRFYRIKERHGFLKKIGRAQYNPKLPLYVSIDELCKGTNEEFCEQIAKRPFKEFDDYLRTL